MSGGLAQAERDWQSLAEAHPLVVSTDEQGGGAGQDQGTDVNTGALSRSAGPSPACRCGSIWPGWIRRDARPRVRDRPETRRSLRLSRSATGWLRWSPTRPGTERVRAAELAVVRAAWQALPVVPRAGDATRDDDAKEIGLRFEALVARTEEQLRLQRSAADRIARLTEVAGALEAISEAAVADLEKAWTSPYREWTTLAEVSTPDELVELAPRIQMAEARRTERLSAAREERGRRAKANLAKQQRRCDELEQALADENLTLNDAERWQRTTRSLLGNLGRLPTAGIATH